MKPKGKRYGENCTVCGEPLAEPQELVSTDDGSAHAACCYPAKTAKLPEDIAFDIWQIFKERFICGETFSKKLSPIITTIQQDAFQAGREAGLRQAAEHLRSVIPVPTTHQGMLPNEVLALIKKD